MLFSLSYAFMVSTLIHCNKDIAFKYAILPRYIIICFSICKKLHCLLLYLKNYSRYKIFENRDK